MQRLISALRFGDVVTGWRAVAVALVAGGPGVLWAVIKSEQGVTFSGVAAGVFFAIWGIWTYGSGLMLRTMYQRLQLADRIVDDLRAQKLEVEMELARQRVQIAQLEEESSDEHRIPRGDRPA